MFVPTRRQFLKAGGASVACGSALFAPLRLLASPFGLPLGLQLYSVRDLLPKDYLGTLKKLAALGYREVEAAGFYNHTAAEVKQAMKEAGLNCVSAHYSSDTLHADLDKIIEFHKVLGAEYIVCSYPGYKDKTPKTPPAAGHERSFTMEDWQWNAEQFNTMGAKVKAAGFNFGYHNHFLEFRAEDGKVPLDEIIRLTDPGLVTFELDCGWVTVGGADPADYLKKYPTRISMLHVKDFKKMNGPMSPENRPEAADLGHGTSDYKTIFAAASKGEIKHYFVEQESFDKPPFEALKIDADYMKNLTV